MSRARKLGNFAGTITASGDLSFFDDTGILDSNGNEIVLFQETTNAVNYIDIGNRNTGNAPFIIANGSDTNVDLSLSGKGSGTIRTDGSTIKTSHVSPIWLSATASTDGILFDSAKQKRISWNDGNGNFTIRGGGYYNTGEKYVFGGDGASKITLDSDGVEGALTFEVAGIGASADDIITYTHTLFMDASGTFTFDNQSIALVGTANTFTQNQIVQRSNPRLILVDDATTDQNYTLQDNGGTFYITKTNDALVGIQQKLQINQDAAPLVLTSSDITYAGQSIARVATANVFTQVQEIKSGAPLLKLTETDTTDQNFWVVADGGTFQVQERTDAEGFTGTRFSIEAGSKNFGLTSTDIIFDNNVVHHDGDEDAWITPTLLNGWVDFGLGWTPAGYRKSANGDVHVRLMIKDGTLSSTVLTLPVGYRPLSGFRLFTGYGNSGVIRWNVDVNGDINMSTGGSTTFSSLECVFRP